MEELSNPKHIILDVFWAEKVRDEGSNQHLTQAQQCISHGLSLVPWHGIDVDGVSAICQAIFDEASAIVVGEMTFQSCRVAQLGAKLCHLEFIRACAA